MENTDTFTNWKEKIGEYKHIPIYMRPGDIKTILENAFSGNEVMGTYARMIDYANIQEGIKALMESKKIRIAYEEENDTHETTLTLHKLLEGTKKFLESCNDKQANKFLWYEEPWRYYDLDMNNMDEETANTILQYALFGKPKY